MSLTTPANLHATRLPRQALYCLGGIKSDDIFMEMTDGRTLDLNEVQARSGLSGCGA